MKLTFRQEEFHDSLVVFLLWTLTVMKDDGSRWYRLPWRRDYKPTPQEVSDKIYDAKIAFKNF